MNWQPIETAPKDGTWILAFQADSPWPGEVEETMWIVRWEPGQRGWKIELDGQSASPTHWMNLPAPPKDGE